MFSRRQIYTSTETFSANINKLKEKIAEADAVFIGAGAGLSTAAGFVYSGERFEKYFADFHAKYGFTDCYSGGFYPFPNNETFWGFWARNIYINRYMETESETYKDLLRVVKDKDYFVLTTNVDHQFQLAGFDKKRLFYTQGDYGLWQCSEPCHQETYDNEEAVYEMLLATGFLKKVGDEYEVDFDNQENWKMEIPSELIPTCPHCGKPLSMNLRADDTFVQDEGWYAASERYSDFVRRHQNLNVVYLEFGVGMNTPVIIKYPFWRATNANPKATYACLNYGEAYAPMEIAKQSICMDADIKKVLKAL